MCMCTLLEMEMSKNYRLQSTLHQLHKKWGRGINILITCAFVFGKYLTVDIAQQIFLKIWSLRAHIKMTKLCEEEGRAFCKCCFWAHYSEIIWFWGLFWGWLPSWLIYSPNISCMPIKCRYYFSYCAYGSKQKKPTSCPVGWSSCGEKQTKNKRTGKHIEITPI